MIERFRPSPTLDQRISAALGNGKVAADDLQALIPEVEVGIEDADAVAARERDQSLDPHTAPQAAEQASHRASVAELQRGRCQVALPRLRERLAEAIEAERADRWHADAERVAARVSDAGEQLASYAEYAELIAVALAGAEAVNKEVERINYSAPDGVNHRIDKVALAHLKTLVLPDPAHPNRNLWPPHKPSIAEQYAESMGAPVHPGADWASEEWQARRAEAARAEQQRQADYYQNLTKQQEARQNAEERERFAQSQRRGA